MQFLTYILLGIVEGVTEFLPISSTGHLVLFIDLLKIKTPEGKVFEVAIQLGAILAVCLAFQNKITDILFNFHRQKSARHFVFLIIISFLPAAIIGFFAHNFIKQALFSPNIIAAMLIIGGGIILLIEKIKPPIKINDTAEIQVKDALIIGLCQAVAMIPGTSRSGATMMGSLMLGINRKVAAEYSFLLAVPTMLAATCYDIYKNYQHLSADDFQMIAIGFISAFISALITVKFLLNFLANHGFKIFAYYRIALGVIILSLMHL